MVCPIWCQSLGSQFHSSGKQGRWYPVRVIWALCWTLLGDFYFPLGFNILFSNDTECFLTRPEFPLFLGTYWSQVNVASPPVFLEFPGALQGPSIGTNHTPPSAPRAVCSSARVPARSSWTRRAMTKSKLHLEPLGFLEGEKRTTLFCSLVYLKGRGGCCKYHALPRVSEVTRGQSYFSRSTPKGIFFLSTQFPTEKPECQGED